MELSDNLKLTKNPFSKRSSEQEQEFISSIFYEPNYYNTLLQDIRDGDSSLIIGQRGHGKSSIVNKLYLDLENEETKLVIKIDRFDSIPLKNNENALIKLIIEKTITKISILLLKNKTILKKLSKNDKEKLEFFIKFFFKPLSKNEFDEIFNKAKKIKGKNLLKRFFNSYLIDLFNSTTNTLINITSQTIGQSLGLNNNSDNNNFTKEYFKKLSIEEVHCTTLPLEFDNKEKLKTTLDELYSLLKKIDIERVIVLVDKIDEYQKLEQDIDKISDFIKEILSDTELLLNNNMAIGFSLWSELKGNLSGAVRFDKFANIDVRWKSDDLVPLLNKRISHFSKSHTIRFEDLILHLNDRNDIVNLSNKSPRDIIILMYYIYLEQSNEDSSVFFFKDGPIRRGMIQFCKEYDYESQFPTRTTGKGKEIKSMLNRLLSIKKISFHKQDMNEHFKQNDKQSSGQIRLMLKYNLIREEEIQSSQGFKLFEIIDQKVIFLIKHQIQRIE